MNVMTFRILKKWRRHDSTNNKQRECAIIIVKRTIETIIIVIIKLLNGGELEYIIFIYTCMETSPVCFIESVTEFEPHAAVGEFGWSKLQMLCMLKCTYRKCMKNDI